MDPQVGAHQVYQLGVGLCTWCVAEVVHLFKKGLLSERGPMLRAW